MEIHFHKRIDSTQKYLIESLKEKKLEPPVAVYADLQTNGVGSRSNGWIGEEGNLFLSFAISRSQLPDDLRIESASIYFAWLLKEVLESFGSKVWLKWPNDFYIEKKKAGGMITNLVADTLVCGVGLNLVSAPEDFAVCDVEAEAKTVVEHFVKKVKKKIPWKQVFRKYSVEFYKNKSFYTHVDSQRISMESAELQEDGSIMINGEKVYSLR